MCVFNIYTHIYVYIDIYMCVCARARACGVIEHHTEYQKFFLTLSVKDTSSVDFVRDRVTRDPGLPTISC